MLLWFPEKYQFLFYWPFQRLWLCGSQQTGKFFKRWEYQTAIPASSEICMQVKKQQLELDMEYRPVPKWERSMSRLILSPCLFNLYAEYIMWNAGLDEAQPGIKFIRRNIYNLRYPDDTTLMAEIEEGLKRLLIKMKEKSEKVDLKLSIHFSFYLPSFLPSFYIPNT